MPLNLNACDKACINCVRKYKKKFNLTAGNKFEIACDGIPKEYLSKSLQETLGKEESETALSIIDPVQWAAKNLDWHCIDLDGEIWKRKDPKEYWDWVKEHPDEEVIGHSRYHRPYQAEMLRCKAQQKIFRIGRQCLTEDSFIQLKNNQTVSIKDIKVGEEVLSVKDNKLLYSTVTDHWKAGIKPVYRIKTKFGHIIECTSNHKFFINNDRIDIKNGYSFNDQKSVWLSIDTGLKQGSKIAIPMCIPFDDQLATDCGEWALLLGYFIADGSSSKGQSSKFTNTNFDYLLEFENACKSLGTNVKWYQKGNGYDLVITNGRSQDNPVRQQLSLFGLTNIVGPEKFIPEIILNSKLDNQKMFLNRFWSADGYVSTFQRTNRDSFRTEIGTLQESFRLVKQIQEMLWRFGVHGHIRPEGNCWRYVISNKKSVANFLKNIGPIFGKELACAKALENLDCVSNKFSYFTDDILWDYVSEIEFIGEKDTYDIEVKETHNFVACGILTHNSGKCLKSFTKIQMADGSRKNIQDIKNGELVLAVDEDYQFQSAPAFLSDNGQVEVLEIILNSGQKIEASTNHPFLRRKKIGRETTGLQRTIYTDEWIDADKLSINDFVAVPANIGAVGTEDYPEIRELELLGFLLADGNTTQRNYRFSNINSEILSRIDSCLSIFDCKLKQYPSSKTADWNIVQTKKLIPKGRNSGEYHKSSFRLWLEKMDLFGKNAHQKFIPNFVFKLKNKYIAALLRSMWGCDGWVSKDKTGKLEIGYCTISYEMSQQISSLLNRFGIFSSCQHKQVKYKNTVRVAYQLTITRKKDIELFAKFIGILGKQDKLEGLTEGYSKTQSFKTEAYMEGDLVFCKIKKIESKGLAQTWDLSVPKFHNFIADNILTHNTETICVSILYYLITKPGKEEDKGFDIIIITPFQSQIELIFKRLQELVLNSPDLQNSIARCVKAPNYTMEFHNKSQIKGFTAGTQSGGNANAVRGQHADMLVFDEADLLSSGDVDSALSILTNSPNAFLWMSSTPTGKRETFYENCFDPGYKEFYYPSQVNPLWNEKLERRFRNQLTEIGYKHEILAEFGEQEEGVFQNAYVQSAKADYAYGQLKYDPNWVYTIGVDWNDTKSGTTICVVGYSPTTNHFYIVDRATVARDGWTQLAACDRIAEFNRLWNPAAIYVDKGFGGCVDGSVLIQTLNGLIPIHKIQIGEQVLTANGEYKHVQDKINSPPKESLKIKIAKVPSLNVSLDHPILTLETVQGFKDTKLNPPIWKKAKELIPGLDFVAIAKEKIPGFIETRIDLVDYLDNLEFDDDNVWNKYTNGSKPVFKRYVDLTNKDFQLILGWYISEGSVSPNSVEISQKTKSVEFNKVIEIAQKMFPSVNVITNPDGLRRLSIVGKVAEQFFTLFGGKGCQNKRIFSDLLKIECSSLIKGILLGDGHVTNQKASQIQLSLTSFTVINQLRQYFINHGVLPSLYLVKRRKEHHKDQLRIDLAGNEETLNKISTLTGFELKNPQRVNRRQYIESKDYLFTPVRKIESAGINSNLYDISVTESNSFTGNGILLHNTQYEVLRKFGYDSVISKGHNHPDAKLKDIVHQYDFGSKIEVHDLFTKQPVDKPAKPFLVENAVRRFETRSISFPKDDTSLEKQLNGYIIDHISPTGTPTYKASDEGAGDHVLDALMLALVGFTLEKTPLGNPIFTTGVTFSGFFGEKTDPQVEQGGLVVKADREHRTANHRMEHRPDMNRTEAIESEPRIIGSINDKIPANNTSRDCGKVGLWSWPGFLRDEPVPAAPNRFNKIMRSGPPKRKNI